MVFLKRKKVRQLFGVGSFIYLQGWVFACPLFNSVDGTRDRVENTYISSRISQSYRDILLWVNTSKMLFVFAFFVLVCMCTILLQKVGSG